MRQISHRDRFAYFFDNTMSRGAVALIAWLGLVSLAFVGVAAAVLSTLHINPGQYLGEYSGNTIRWEDEQGNVFTGQASGSDQVAGVVKYFRNGQWEQVGTFSASRK